MNTDNQTKLLRDAAIEPTDKVLENVLGAELYQVYRELVNTANGELGIEYEWRYYNDGKSWLFKAVNKKKTVFWLSIWDGHIKTSFYFTEKTGPGIFDLPVSDAIKEKFRNADRTGKLIPLILEIHSKKELEDFREIAGYKKQLK